MQTGVLYLSTPVSIYNPNQLMPIATAKQSKPLLSCLENGETNLLYFLSSINFNDGYF